MMQSMLNKWQHIVMWQHYIYHMTTHSHVTTLYITWQHIKYHDDIQRRLRSACTTVMLFPAAQWVMNTPEKRKCPRDIPTYQTPVRPTKKILLREVAQRSSVHRPRNIFSSRLQINNKHRIITENVVRTIKLFRVNQESIIVSTIEFKQSWPDQDNQQVLSSTS